MTYNFDTYIDRHNTGAYKYEVLGSDFGNANAIPMWVADMEFACPSFIVNAMKARLEHPIFGYTMTPKAIWENIAWWQQHRHGWAVEREWMTFIPGIVRGIAYAINTLVAKDQKIIIQPPVYHPFRHVPEAYGRQIVENPLIERPDGLYEMDFDNLAKITDSKCRLLILCNPHNPGGVCWSRETLERLAAFCSEHGIIVISDEIHADMTLFGHKHIPFASVSEEAAQCSITFGAPSKVFNMPGVVCSYAIVPNEQLRQQFFGWLGGAEFDEPSIMSGIALAAAYTPEGDEWRQQMLHYVEENVLTVERFCEEHFRSNESADAPLLIRPIRPEASFLIWLDCRELHMEQEQLVQFFTHKAGLALNDGASFGPGGQGHMRMNIACNRETLMQALNRLKDALKDCRA